jgi:hypothetical protein
MVLGFSQPLTETSTRNLPGGKGQPARKADNLTAMSRLFENVGAQTSHNPMGLHGLLQGQLYLIFILLLSRYIVGYDAVLTDRCVPTFRRNILLILWGGRCDDIKVPLKHWYISTRPHWYHIPQNCDLHIHCCENLTSHKLDILFPCQN